MSATWPPGKLARNEQRKLTAASWNAIGRPL